MKFKKILTAVMIVFVLSLTLSLVSAQDATETPATPVPGSGLITGPMDGEAQALTGAGSTFAQPLYTNWFSGYAQLTNVQINYQGIGSGGGIKGITDGTIDFGATDAPMTAAQLQAAYKNCSGTVLHIATALGGVVLTYNIPELSDASAVLKLSPATLAGVFLGDISMWNDPLLVADNPALANVAQPISVVHRSDSSGTTNIFTTYLKAVSPKWSSAVGAGTAVSWPTGIGQKGSAGIAGAISGVPYAIGYVEAGYAEQNTLPITLLKNKAGNFVGPTTANVSAAAAGVTLPADMRIMIVNGSGDNTYPISGFTWALVCQTISDQSKAIAITRALWWGIHDGQMGIDKLGYAPLPEAAIQKDEAQLLKIKTNGQQALPTAIATPAK